MLFNLRNRRNVGWGEAENGTGVAQLVLLVLHRSMTACAIARIFPSGMARTLRRRMSSATCSRSA